MQKLAEQVADPADTDTGGANAAVKDEQTRKQINDIQDALNGKAPAEASDKTAVKSDQRPDDADKLATAAVAKAVNGSVDMSAVAPAKEVAKPAEAPKKRAAGEIPSNLSAETGAALKRFDSLLNGSAKLDRPDFASRLRSRPNENKSATTAKSDKTPTAPVARVGQGEEPGVRKINKASISGTDPQPEYVPPKADKPQPVETKTDRPKSTDAKPPVTGAAEQKQDEVPAEAKQSDPALETVDAPENFAVQENAGKNQPDEFVDDAAIRVAGSGREDTHVDFFAIRRTLRQLQFNYSINKPHDDKIREEFEVVLASFSKMSVMYQSMSEDHTKRSEDRDQLVKARSEARELTAELQKAQQQEKSAETRRKKDLEAFAQLTARQNASRGELREAQQQVETLKREMTEQAQEFKSKQAEGMKLVEEASLAEAEKTVLRESLTEACDKIAELLSGELRNESIIQALEDELEQYRVNAERSHG